MKMYEERFISKKIKTVISLFTAVLIFTCSMQPVFAEKETEDAGAHANVSSEEEIDYAGEYLKGVMNLINDCYIGDISVEDLVKGAISGMAEKLDEYSEFLDTDELNETLKDAANLHVGLGISYYVNYDDGYPYITTVYSGSPAEKAGIMKYDVLISIDGTDVKNKDGDEITALVSGKKGESVEVVVKRGDDEKTLSVKIDDYTTPTVFVSNVDSLLEGLDKNKANKVRYIQISSFGDKTGEEFRKIAEKLKKENVEGIIIDLRFNGGGVTQSAYEICETLVKEGPFLNIERKDGKYNVNSEDDSVPFKNIAVLTNEATASASELLAAVLKDNGAAVIGTKTYGKGVTQAVIELKEVGALKMTTEEFFPMSGIKINGVGIVPDYEVKQIKVVSAESEDFQKDIETALKALKYDIATNEKKAAAIKEIQKKYFLKETGEADKDTVSAINSEIVNKNYTDDNVFEKAVEVIFGKL